jgi:hypothetical protein
MDIEKAKVTLKCYLEKIREKNKSEEIIRNFSYFEQEVNKKAR